MTLKGQFTDLNTYISSLNASRYGGATIKSDETWRARSDCIMSEIKKIDFVPFIIFKWVVPDRKKDKDNISFAKKFILDGITTAHLWKNDGFNNIQGFMDVFSVDKYNPAVHVFFIENIKKISISDYLVL